jgi:hypothetical protein
MFRQTQFGLEDFDMTLGGWNCEQIPSPKKGMR